MRAFAARRPRLASILGALAASGAITGIALPFGSAVPLIGAPIMALVVGMAVAAVVPMQRLRSGLGPTSRYALQAGIVVLGATIGLQQVASVGATSVPVMLGSLLSALLTAALLGRGLGVPERLRVLVGVGTGICGASAIAAVSQVVRAREHEIRYAISTIFAFNLVAVLVFPPLGHLLGMSQDAFGLWAGTAINDTSSVVAASFAYGDTAGAHAVIVKLVRTTMIIPIAFALAAVAVRRRRRAQSTDDAAARSSVTSLVPWFVLWFLAASALSTISPISAAVRSDLSHVSLVLTTIALAAVGLSSNFAEMRRTSIRPFLLGAAVWATVTVTSLALQALTGTI